MQRFKSFVTEISFNLGMKLKIQSRFQYPFKRKPHKMVKQTQTIRRQFAGELFECVVGLAVKGYDYLASIVS